MVFTLEPAYPLRVLRYRLRRGSGGAGFSPGGEGIERDLEMLEDGTVSLITERRVSRLRAGDEAHAERLPDKCTVVLRARNVIRVMTPGGAGWGAPPLPL